MDNNRLAKQLMETAEMLQQTMSDDELLKILT